MQKREKQIGAISVKRLGRLPLMAIVFATSVLAIGAATVVSKQMVKTKATEELEGRSAVTNSSNKNYVAGEVAGQNVPVDSQTGQIRPLTAQEAQQLAAGIKAMVNQSTEGLTSVRHADGSVSVDLQDRFQNVTLARKNTDGTVSQTCVDNPRSAAAFFQLDPQLFEEQTKTGTASKSTKQAKPSPPVKRENQ